MESAHHDGWQADVHVVDETGDGAFGPQRQPLCEYGHQVPPQLHRSHACTHRPRGVNRAHAELLWLTVLCAWVHPMRVEEAECIGKWVCTRKQLGQ